MSSLFSLSFKKDFELKLLRDEMLFENRLVLSATAFQAVCISYSRKYGLFDWTPDCKRFSKDSFLFKLVQVDKVGRRFYEAPMQVSSSALAKKLPEPHSSFWHKPNGVGIENIELYVPRHSILSQDLEMARNSEGKYSEGLGMIEYRCCGDDEDATSMALTVVSRLLERNGVSFDSVGWLGVGTESLTDRSKSIKSSLMRLFEANGASQSCEGVDHINACYGGTAALFSGLDWVNGAAWDGRWAVVVCSDVADAPEGYEFLTGAAAVAMLVGPNASLQVEGVRVSWGVDRWDFWKPVGWKTMGPLMEGAGSMNLYYECLKKCLDLRKERTGEKSVVQSHEHIVFHLGSGPRFVRKAFEVAVAHDMGRALIHDGDVEALFESKTKESLYIAARVGPMHTAALYANLFSLMHSGKVKVGDRIAMFSYGSGAMSSLFSIKTLKLMESPAEVFLEPGKKSVSAEDFRLCLKAHAAGYGRFCWKPETTSGQVKTEFYIESVDARGRRFFRSDKGLIKVNFANSKPKTGKFAQTNRKWNAANVLSQIEARIREIVGVDNSEKLDLSRPLAEFGFDSLLSVELRNTLNKDFDLELPASLLFDFPTGLSLTNKISELMMKSHEFGASKTSSDHLKEAVLTNWSKDTLARKIEARIREIAGIDNSEKLDLSRPLAEFGFDSLLSVEFRNTLNKDFDLDLPASLLFDYPSGSMLIERIQDSVLKANHRPESRLMEKIQVFSNTVVSGIACRFANIRNLSGMWDLLANGTDSIKSIPPNRFDSASYTSSKIPNWGGFVEQISEFDAAFFHISPREAIVLDPQHRLLLECTWEACELGGKDPVSFSSQNVAVYVGIAGCEYETKVLEIDAYFATSVALSTAAGRVSYFFAFTGPSLSIDTACSSSLVALDAALSFTKSVHQPAFAMGVNAVIDPKRFIAFTAAGMLSPDGRCKTFDRRANGFVRAEGCSVLLLETENESRPSPKVIGSFVNQDGRSNGLTAPNGPSQVKLVCEALRVAGCHGRDVAMLEAHGTGTALGDPIEVQAVAEAMGGERHRETGLVLGSAKTNFGHTETAAGLLGVLKALICLERRTIVQHLHLMELNEYIGTGLMEGMNCVVPVESIDWSKDFKKRAGVSSFGFSGTNAHVIFEGCSSPEVQVVLQESSFFIRICGKDAESGRELAKKYAIWMVEDVGNEKIFAKGTKMRSRMNYMRVVECRSRKEAKELLLSDSYCADDLEVDLGLIVPTTYIPTYAFKRISFWPKHDPVAKGEELMIKNNNTMFQATGMMEMSWNSSVPDDLVIIIGGGLMGLYAAIYLKTQNRKFLLLEKSGCLGGCWVLLGNSASRTQTEIGTYNLFQESNSCWSTSSYPGKNEILKHIHEAVNRYDIMKHVLFNHEVKSVSDAGSFKVLSTKTPFGAKSFNCSAVWCFTGRLVSPRGFMFPPKFLGKVFRGYSNDVNVEELKGKRVVILGHGAFALENLRVALEAGSESIVIICRRRYLVIPRIASWAINCGALGMKISDLQKYVLKAYKFAGVDPPFVSSDDFPYGLSPVSDVYFLAIKSGKVKVVESPSVEFGETFAVTPLGNYDCDVIIECYGFKPAESESIYGGNPDLHGFWVRNDPSLFYFREGQDSKNVSQFDSTTAFSLLSRALSCAVFFLENPSEFKKKSNLPTSKLSYFGNAHIGLTFSALQRSFPVLERAFQFCILEKSFRTLRRHPPEDFASECINEFKSYADAFSIDDRYIFEKEEFLDVAKRWKSLPCWKLSIPSALLFKVEFPLEATENFDSSFVELFDRHGSQFVFVPFSDSGKLNFNMDFFAGKKICYYDKLPDLHWFSTQVERGCSFLLEKEILFVSGEWFKCKGNSVKPSIAVLPGMSKFVILDSKAERVVDFSRINPIFLEASNANVVHTEILFDVESFLKSKSRRILFLPEAEFVFLPCWGDDTTVVFVQKACLIENSMLLFLNTVNGVFKLLDGNFLHQMLPDLEEGEKNKNLAEKNANFGLIEAKIVVKRVLNDYFVDIEDNEDFFSKGLDSVGAIFLRDELSKKFGSDFPATTLYDFPTIDSLSKRVAFSSYNEIAEFDLVAEFFDLRKKLRVTSMIGGPRIRKKRILLTGPGGFFGSHILSELLESSDCTIVCVSSKSSQGLKNVFSKFDLDWKTEFDERIILLDANLESEEEELSKKIDAVGGVDGIIFAGSWVNHLALYDSLKKVNVYTLITFLNLASKFDAKFIFISSFAVQEPAPTFGYAVSKKIGEWLCLEASTLGLNVSIFRPGDLGFSTQTGAFNLESRAHMSIVSCMQLGVFPKEMDCGFYPVNEAAVMVRRNLFSSEERMRDIKPIILTGKRVLLSNIFEKLKLQPVASVRFRELCTKHFHCALNPFVGTHLLHTLALPCCQYSSYGYSVENFQLMFNFAWKKNLCKFEDAGRSGEPTKIDKMSLEYFNSISNRIGRSWAYPKCARRFLVLVESNEVGTISECLSKFFDVCCVSLDNVDEKLIFSFAPDSLLVFAEKPNRFQEFKTKLKQRLVLVEMALSLGSQFGLRVVYFSSLEAMIPSDHFPLGMVDCFTECLFERFFLENYPVTCLRIGTFCSKENVYVHDPLVDTMLSVGVCAKNYHKQFVYEEQLAEKILKLIQIPFQRSIYVLGGRYENICEWSTGMGSKVIPVTEVEFFEKMKEHVNGEYHYLVMVMDHPPVCSDADE